MSQRTSSSLGHVWYQLVLNLQHVAGDYIV
jgi:hypothetical protein